MKKLLLSIVTVGAVLITPTVVFAHVIVTPSQVGVAKEQLFNISVPNEQQTPVVSLKLQIPSGVTAVVPTTKDGWTITTNGSGDTITAITWAGGQIPVGQRTDFSFDAQVPAKASELDWKAFQTYGDGTIVHWDQKPAGSDDSTGNAGPYSVTNVINDLIPSSTSQTPEDQDKTAVYALGAGILGIILGGVALALKRK